MNPNQAFALGNILRVVPVNPATNGDFTDENGFFIRAETKGYLRYCPKNNLDTEYIEKYFDASNIFVDPELCRKIFGTVLGGAGQRDMASSIYIGYGV
ncbi:MAG: hypothetical protein MUO72_09395 [Bacteroidales bacterium]|nr:hypothetical protein [Bacteroidales bacterium]